MLNNPGTNKRGRKAAAALAGCALMLTAACGGGGGRPSTSSIEKAISSKSDNNVFGTSFSSMSKDARDCIAKALHDSKLSDSALRAIVDNKKDYKGNSTDKKALSGLSSQIMKCASSAAK